MHTNTCTDKGCLIQIKFDFIPKTPKITNTDKSKEYKVFTFSDKWYVWFDSYPSDNKFKVWHGENELTCSSCTLTKS